MSDESNEPETVIVEETGDGPFQNRVVTGETTLLVDEPVGAGGSGSGPNPYDLLCAALGSCTTMTVRLYARRKAWPLERVRAHVSRARGTSSSKDHFRVDVELMGPLDAEQRAKLLDIAKRCPVHLTLERGAEVENRLVEPGADKDDAVTRCDHALDMMAACEETG